MIEVEVVLLGVDKYHRNARLSFAELPQPHTSFEVGGSVYEVTIVRHRPVACKDSGDMMSMAYESGIIIADVVVVAQYVVAGILDVPRPTT